MTIEFAARLLDAVAADTEDNIVVSPLSVALVLGMLEPGTTGTGREELRRLLGVDDPESFHEATSQLVADLEARTDDGGEVAVRVANGVFVDETYRLDPGYVDGIEASLGPVVRTVDFRGGERAAVKEINQFVADGTAGRISDILAEGALRPETAFALVNALYLKASWLEVFPAAQTQPAPFTPWGGDQIDVQMMHGRSGSSARGTHWVGAAKAYVGGLAAQFILPDDGHFEDVASSLAAVLDEFEANRTAGAALALPRVQTRSNVGLGPAFKALGLGALYREGNLTGIANDPRLVLDVAVHETFLAMDEEGTEAAAATVLTGYPTSGPSRPPVPVTLDRPFLVRIYDQITGATLFLGRITNPASR